jgi:hypothetical protein
VGTNGHVRVTVSSEWVTVTDNVHVLYIVVDAVLVCVGADDMEKDLVEVKMLVGVSVWPVIDTLPVSENATVSLLVRKALGLSVRVTSSDAVWVRLADGERK